MVCAQGACVHAASPPRATLHHTRTQSDGTFRGYKGQPSEGDFPINVFEVPNSTIQELVEKKTKNAKFGFQVRDSHAVVV